MFCHAVTCISHFLLQLNIQTRDMRESCLLIMESGQVVSPAVDNKIDYYFDQMLESVAEWRDGMRLTHDVSLLGKLHKWGIFSVNRGS